MTWLIGAGLMAKEYIKVLQHLGSNFIVIGRSNQNTRQIEQEFKCKVFSGGIEQFLRSNPDKPDNVIVAVGVEDLQSVTMQLLQFDVKDILLEKPGVAYPNEIKTLCKLAKTKNAHVLLAYNRRYYTSVRKAKELINEEGGPTSCFFEFTEWSHLIKDLKKHPAEHQNWFLGNSSHVIDTAFYLCGPPNEICSFTSGSLEWHTAASIFSGAGRTDNGVLFSYIANWEAPGRWGLEVMTRMNRYIFRPMEKLQRMKIGSVAIEEVEGIDYSIDQQFKPGILLQTRNFLSQNYLEFADVYEQEKMIREVYNRMLAPGAQ